MPSNGPHSAPDPPDRERDLAERGRVLVTSAAARVRAPEELRGRIEADRERLRPVRRRRTVGLAGALAAGLAAVAAAFAIGIGGAGEPPTVLGTAEATADATPTMAAPAPDRAQPVLLRAKMDGVSFPQWDELGWPAVGARRDEIAGREAMTVFYEGRRGARVAYTIIGGEPLEIPSDAYRKTVNGIDLSILQRGDRKIVVWERDGHTCVMSAPLRVRESKLLDLAAWDAGGAVPF
jgi:hypothetical protein